MQYTVSAFLLVVMSLVMGSQCSRMGQREKLLAQIAVQTATVKVVSNNPEYGPRIVEIVDKVVDLVNRGEINAIAVVDEFVRGEIRWQKLAPEDRVIVDILLQVIRAELEERVKQTAIPAEYAIVIKELAGWIREAAAAASPSNG